MESEKKHKVTEYELAASNKVVMICHFIVDFMISAAYFVEFLKGDRTLVYVLVTILLAMLPPVLELVFYTRKKNTTMVRHFVAFGFAVLYVFVMLTTSNYLSFVYVIPMLIAITVYNDFKYSLPIEVGVLLVNVAQLVMFFRKGLYTSENMASVEIQIFVIILISGIQLYTSIVTEKINEKKLENLKEEHGRTEKILNHTVQVSDKMIAQIMESAEKIAILGESMRAMKESMEEVNSGSMIRQKLFRISLDKQKRFRPWYIVLKKAQQILLQA